MKNLNLSGRLVGLTCILLLVFTSSASGQGSSFTFPIHGAGSDPERNAGPAETVPSNWIILLEGKPVSTFRLQLGRDDLDESQKNQVRAYSSKLEADRLTFLEAARRQGFTLTVQRKFSFLLNGMAVSIPDSEAARLAELLGVQAVYPDRQVHLELADSVPLIGADQVWELRDANSQAVTGQGIRVAVIDTGIDYTHPDLGGCFGPGCKVVDGYDLYNDDADPLDDNGHGTHCAGIAAANGSLKGVAPGASLYAYKVLSAYGTGNVSVIIAGIEQAADPDQDPATADAVDIISMSLGLPGNPDDPWPLAVNAAVELGIVVAVSAGNSGPAYGSIESPGVARLALTVGAADKLDQIAPFSSRGPIPGYDGWLKPDLLAPGVAITSTYLSGAYAAASGTSMAAPHVAGAAALVKQMHPAWAPDQIKASLMNTALDLGLDIHTQGAGRLRVDQAVLTPGLATPASLSFGTADISQPLWSDARLLWLENVSDTTLTYSLSAGARLADSVTISVEPTSLTLQPGEKRSVSVVLAVDTLQTPPDLERDAGLIRVQHAGAELMVPFAFLMPPIFEESYSLPFGLQTSYAIALQDLDGDGDLDAFVGNTSYYDNPANTVWFNDGEGNFTDSGQRLGSTFTWDVALGDLDGDGDIDVFSANSEVESAQPDEVWLNNGQGYFSDSGQQLGNSLSRAVALGDLDGDGDLDAFIVNGITERGRPQADTVWLNDGAGNFSDSGQALGSSAGLDVALGDLDDDGDLDAFIANGDPQRVRDEPNTVWLNDGHAFFSNSGQILGNALSQAVALGDLDGDSDLDAFIANGGPAILDGQPDEVWLNDGSGVFSSSGQSLGSRSSYGAALGDLHQDGTLDVFVAGYRGGNRVWLNDGGGNLSLSSPGFGTESAADVALGDVDGDGDIDALAANAISRPNRLWLNRGSGAPPLQRLAAPSNLTANPLSGSTIHLAWMDNALDETSYKVERSPDGESEWVEIALLPANSLGFEDSSLSCEQIYFYRVRAYRDYDGLYSAYSHIASAQTTACSTPAPPTGLTATPISESQINLAWTDNAIDESAYHVERSLDGTTGWVEIAWLPAETENYSDDGLACETKYYYRVRAYRAADSAYSAYSDIENASTWLCPLPAPSGLSASAVSASQVDLAWTDNAIDESAYYVERSLDGSTGWVEIASLPGGTEFYSNTGLECGTQYFYRVRAYRSADGSYSDYSDVASATTQLCQLPAPSGLSAVAVSSSQVNLAWTDNAVDESAYRVERSLDGIAGWAEIASLPGDAESYSDSGLACETEYYYQVRAYRAGDEAYSAFSSAASAVTSLCPLTEPSGLTATAAGATQIKLAWTDNAVDESAYRVERSLDGIAGWAETAWLPADTESYSDSGLTCEVQYFYRVRAYRAADGAYSAYSGVANALTWLCPLPAPSGLSATAVSSGKIDLAWTDNAVDESAYLVERYLDGVIGWTEIAVLPANSSGYSDTGLNCDASYSYRVRSYRAADGAFSSYSTTATAATDLCPLVAPTGLAANTASISQIDLTWVDHALDETTYYVERSMDGLSGWAEIAALSENTTSYADVALSCGILYYYRVRAYRAMDQAYSAYSEIANAVTDFCNLNAPTNLTASDVSQSQIDLAWTDNADTESAYRVDRSQDGSTGWAEIALLPAGTETYSDSSLTCGTQYFYRVRAYRAADGAYSDYSDVAFTTTQLCPLPAPTEVSALAASSSQIDLTWTDHALDETSYHVERSLDGVTGWKEIAFLPANSNGYQNTGLACGTAYSFRIRAYRESDRVFSAYSDIAKSMTDTCSYWIYLPVLNKIVP